MTAVADIQMVSILGNRYITEQRIFRLDCDTVGITLRDLDFKGTADIDAREIFIIVGFFGSTLAETEVFIKVEIFVKENVSIAYSIIFICSMPVRGSQ